MKLGIKLTLIVLFALVAPMIIPGPDGKPIMTIDDWIPHDLIASIGKGTDTVSDVIEGGSEAIEAGITGAGSQIYTWRDDNGVLHYSDQPFDGSMVIEVPDDGLAIPARHFVDRPTGVPVMDAEPGGGKSFLLKDRSSSGDSAGGIEKSKPRIEELDGKLKAIAEGDISSLGELTASLPELLEQAKTAREQIRTE